MENIRLKMDRVDYWEKHHMLPLWGTSRTGEITTTPKPASKPLVFLFNMKQRLVGSHHLVSCTSIM